MIFSNWDWYSSMVSLLGGVWVVIILGMLIMNPERRFWGKSGYFLSKPASNRSVSQNWTLYGVRACNFLSSRAILSSMWRCGATETVMSVVMIWTGTSWSALPITTDWATVLHGENLVGADGKGQVRIVPNHDWRAVDDFMRVAAKANSTGGVDSTGCAHLKVWSPGCEWGLVYQGIFWWIMRTLWRERTPAIVLLLTGLRGLSCGGWWTHSPLLRLWSHMIKPEYEAGVWSDEAGV